ncbi:MAG: hypothetical protein JWP61_2395 [Friedmanniella sp.]|nr:hypothetical protein [Friedmanniella sp.]
MRSPLSGPRTRPASSWPGHTTAAQPVGWGDGSWVQETWVSGSWAAGTWADTPWSATDDALQRPEPDTSGTV